MQNNSSNKNQKINFKKITHLDDFWSDQSNVINSQIAGFGDDVYHDHGFYEIIYLINGEIPHFVNETQMNLVSGDILFLRPGDRHLFLRDDEEKLPKNRPRHRDILFKKDFFKEVMTFLDGTDGNFSKTYHSPALPIKINVSMKKIEELESLIENYFLLKPDDTTEKLLIAKFILISLLNCLKSNMVEQTESSEQYPAWIKNLLHKMNMRQLYKEGLPAILSQFTYSSSYMCNMFKKYTGMTMTDYLNDLRLQYAANQIKLTSATILAISQEVGFTSISYFNKQFKKKYHCTPRQYRALNKPLKN